MDKETNRPERGIEPKISGTDKKKAEISIWKVVVATVVGVLLLAVLAGALIYGITGKLPYGLGKDKKPTATTAANGSTPTKGQTGGEETEPTDLGLRIEGITDKAVYSAELEAAMESADTVIATIGDYELTNRLLQVFYWRQFSSFVTGLIEDGTDPTEYGLDITMPMYEQKVLDTDVTWEQYFLDNALATWWQYACVNAMADKAGFTLTEEEQASLAEVSKKLEEEAVADGFADAEAMVDARLSPMCSLADYVDYMTLTARGDLYYSHYLEDYKPTEEEVQEFFELNADYFAYYYGGVTMDSGKLASVRHVLIRPEGAEVDSYNRVTATDEQWEACRVQGQAMLDAWVAAGATEDGFQELAKQHSVDGSAKDGGMIGDFFTGQMVEAFDAWSFDTSRKYGDYGMVRTEYGYHLMFFVELSEHDAWYEYAYPETINYGYGFNNELNEFMAATELNPKLDSVAVTDLAQAIPEAEETEQETTEAE